MTPDLNIQRRRRAGLITCFTWTMPNSADEPPWGVNFRRWQSAATAPWARLATSAVTAGAIHSSRSTSSSGWPQGTRTWAPRPGRPSPARRSRPPHESAALQAEPHQEKSTGRSEGSRLPHCMKCTRSLYAPFFFFGSGLDSNSGSGAEDGSPIARPPATIPWNMNGISLTGKVPKAASDS